MLKRIKHVALPPPKGESEKIIKSGITRAFLDVPTSNLEFIYKMLKRTK